MKKSRFYFIFNPLCKSLNKKTKMTRCSQKHCPDEKGIKTWTVFSLALKSLSETLP